MGPKGRHTIAYVHLWRERLNRWLLPFASRLTLPPNAITLLALFTNLCATALLIAGGSKPILFPMAALSIAAGGLLDALDGAVARAHDRSSRFGDFLDHFCDRVSDLAILTGWCIGAVVRFPLTLAAILAVMLNGYIGTQVEASFGRRSYRGAGRGEFVLAAVAFPLLQFALIQSRYQRVRLGGLTVAEWLTAVLTLFALIGILERFAEARQMGR